MGQKHGKNKGPSQTKSNVNGQAKSDQPPTHDQKHEQAVQYGMQVMRTGFVKVDHFENIYRISPKFEGVPNLRQVKGFQIYGSGQPNKSALEKLLAIWFGEMQLGKCLWINMRSEPVLYVKDMSLAPRDPKHPSENVDFGEDGIITIDDINQFNSELERVVKANLSSNSNVFVYHKDTYAPLPADRKDMVLEFECEHGAADVYGLQSLYKDELAGAQKLNVQLERVTVEDEKAPSPSDIVNFVEILSKHADENTVVCFNCQMGKGRTTEGMIMACLMQQTLRQDKQAPVDSSSSDLWPHEIPSESEEWTAFLRKLSEQQESPNDANSEEQKSDDALGLSVDAMKKGEFTLVQQLVDVLSNAYELDGAKIKQTTDDIIDANQHLTNMRECIYLAKLRYFHEKRQDQRGYWLKMARQFLQRYYVLIVFNAYLHDVVLKQGKKLSEVNYIQWMQTKPKINENLGTLQDGALSKFEWD